MLKVKKVFDRVQIEENKKQLELKNINRTSKDITPGDVVLVKLPLLKDQTKALSPRLFGPYRVIEVKQYKIVIKAQTGRCRYNIHINHVIKVTDVFNEEMLNWLKAEEKLLNSNPENNPNGLDRINEDSIKNAIIGTKSYKHWSEAEELLNKLEKEDLLLLPDIKE